MKWPFARTEKDALKETTRLLATPPRPRPVSKIGVPDDLRKTQALTLADTIPAVNLEAEVTIPVQFGSIAPQVSAKLFVHDIEEQLAGLTVNIPAKLIIPQLTTGRVKLDWADLVPLIPADLLKRPAPPGVDQPAVTLPMGEVVAAIPPEAFTIQGEEAADLNSEEFEDLPQLFDDAFFQDRSQPSETAAPDTPPPAPKPEPVTPVVKPVQKPYASTESIFVKLRSLVAGMPDNVFACPRAELWQKADPNTEIALPIAPLVPMLGTARLTLPLEIVIQAISPELFVSPLPSLEGQVVALPLHEVVRQLPPSLFSIQTKAKQPEATEPSDSDELSPFREKSPAPAETVAVGSPVTTEPPTVEEPVTAEVEPTPVPQEVAEPPVAEESPIETTEPQTTELEEPSLADESFAIFAEKPQAPEVPAAPTPEPEPEPEPVEAVASEPVVIEPTAEPTPVLAETPTTPPSDFLINLNRCTFEDLQLIDGVGPALARRIIEYREAHGAFQSVYELRNVPGVGRKTFGALAGVPLRRLNRLLGVDHDTELSLTEITRLISALPGVDGCVLATSDGLPLTGQLPPQFDQERFSVFAPQLFKRVSRCTRELSVGDVNRLTLFTDEQPVSIFKAGTIYLVVVHHPDRFSKALLRRCANISEELARLCRQRAAV